MKISKMKMYYYMTKIQGVNRVEKYLLKAAKPLNIYFNVFVVKWIVKTWTVKFWRFTPEVEVFSNSGYLG